MAFLKYSSPTPSLELVERIRSNQSTLIVPGIHLGLERYLRIWPGGEKAYLEEGLRRVRRRAFLIRTSHQVQGAWNRVAEQPCSIAFPGTGVGTDGTP